MNISRFSRVFSASLTLLVLIAAAAESPARPAPRTTTISPAVAAYTPPSPPPAYFEYLNDAYYSMANRSTSSGSLIATSTGATQATSANTAYQQQYEVLFNLEDNTYRIRDRDSGLCIGALNKGTAVGTPVATISYTYNDPTQRWYLTGTGGGYWAFINVASGLAMQTDGGNPAKVTLQAVNTANTQQQWLADPSNPADHYPKRGQCGYDGLYYLFGGSWVYNYGPTFGYNLPFTDTFIPNQIQLYYPNTNDLGGGYNAMHSGSAPQYILTFNEPDHTDQANMTTDQAMSLWPALQNIDIPLLSPATASAYDGWLDDFYNKIHSNNYRVDYTAVHAYTQSTNLSNYFNYLSGIAYNGNWNHPIWVSEFGFSTFGASGYSWSEEDVWTFMAEFMWQAEDATYLRRYSLFPFNGDPSANPWDHNAYNSNLLKGDQVTLTALGELYSAWDGNRSILARTSYLLQGKLSMHRLSSSTANSDFPAGSPYLSQLNIRFSGPEAQWALLPSPTSGQYYIISLLDSRRLQTDGNGVSLAAPGTTGTGVQWQIAPDSSGYFFINNLATNTTLYSQRYNDGNGAPTSVYSGVTASGNASDSTRFRLVKPAFPVSVPTAAPLTPTSLVVTPGDRRNVLSWTSTGATYTITRGTSLHGTIAPTTLVTNWPLSTYVDNSAVNGTTYYYTVTAANILSETSVATAAVTGLPAANYAVADLEGNYKFEASSAQDNSGNVEGGAVFGTTTFFTPGRIDGSAVNFDGSTGYIQLPAVVANDFSLTFWMRTTSAGGAGAQWYNGSGLVDAEVPGAAADFGTALLNGKLAFGIGNPDTTITSTSAVNDGAWHHVVTTRNGTTGTIQVYIDGTLQAAGTGPTGTRSAPTGIRLGALQSGGNYFQGDMDEVRLYSYVLAPVDIAKLAIGATDAQVAEYSFSGNTVQDTSGQGNHGTPANVSYASPGQGSNAVAAQFDGSTSYARLPESLTDDFSIAYWIKTTSTGLVGTQWYQGAGIVDAEVPGTMNDFGTSLLGGKAAFGIGNPDTTITSTSAINDGAWHQVTATRTNSNGTMRLYVDGQLQATGTGAIGPRTAPAALALGRSLPGYNYFLGQLDDVRLYNYPLGAGQVLALTNPLPTPWNVLDIGNPAVPGFASLLNGALTVGGSGADIWMTGDQFSFANVPQTGAGTLITRVTSLPINADGTTTANAKAGLMFRDGSSASAAFVDVVYDQTQGLQFIERASTGATAGQSFANVTGLTAPFWLKLVCGGTNGSVGNYFQAYYSTLAGTTPPSGRQWTSIGTYTVPFTSGASLAGVAITSHANGTLASAGFDTFNLAPNTAPSVVGPVNQTLSENTSSAALTVSVGDAESNPAGLLLTAMSSNPTLLPASGIVLAGSSVFRTVQLIPAAYQAGSTTVTLSVTDGQAVTTTSFVLTVTTSAAGNWREQYFGTTANSGLAADGANPAADGLSNFLKRAYGLNPLVNVGNLAAVTPQVYRDASAGTLSLTYTRAAAANVPDLTFQVLWSADLQTWSNSQVTDATTATNAPAGTETHQASVPLSLGSRLFLRLQVTRSN